MKSDYTTALESLNQFIKSTETLIHTLQKDVITLSTRGDFEGLADLANRLKSLTELHTQTIAIRDSFKVVASSNRFIGVSTESESNPRRSRPHNVNEFLWIPILQTLHESGGSLTIHELCDRAYPHLKPYLEPKHYREYSSGNPERPHVKWRVDLSSCKARLTAEGLLLQGLSKGSWTISEKGVQYLLCQLKEGSKNNDNA